MRRLRAQRGSLAHVLPIDEIAPTIDLDFIDIMFLQENVSMEPNTRSLLAALVVFSGASLLEKCRLCIHLFDSGGRGMMTGSDFCDLSMTIIATVYKALNIGFKPRVLRDEIHDSLSSLFRSYQEMVTRSGDRGFYSEGVITSAEIIEHLDSFRAVYEALPISDTSRVKVTGGRKKMDLVTEAVVDDLFKSIYHEYHHKPADWFDGITGTTDNGAVTLLSLPLRQSCPVLPVPYIIESVEGESGDPVSIEPLPLMETQKNPSGRLDESKVHPMTSQLL